MIKKIKKELNDIYIIGNNSIDYLDMIHCTLAGYKCMISGLSEGAADAVVIILHGLGASNTNFEQIGHVLTQAEPALYSKSIVYVLPQAHSSDMGPAWWDLDVSKFLAAFMGGDAALGKLLREEHPGVAECRRDMSKLVEESRALAGGEAGPLPTSRVLMAGFSQGGMTAMDVALHQPAEGTFGAVAMFSSAPICVEQWATQLQVHKGLRALVCHGLTDPVIPYEACGWMQALLNQHGAKVTFVQHGGGHELGGNVVLRAFAQLVLSIAS